MEKKEQKELLNRQIKSHAVWTVMTTIGTFIMAIGFSVFLAPRNIVSGGFSGISLILSNCLKRFFDIDISKGIIYVILNIPLFIIGWKYVGKSFAFLSLWGMLTYSVFIDLVKLNLTVDDSLLCALYGGICDGIGLGLVVRSNASTGGTDMLGNIIRAKNDKITVGTVVIAINVVIIAMNVLYTESILVALYAVVAIFIEGLICDYISEGPRSIKAYYVISEKYQEIAERVLTDMNRGVTCLEVQGMFSHADRKMLLCLISRREVNQLNNIVFSIDRDAFVFSTNCKDAIGNGFSKPAKPIKETELSRIMSGEKIENSIEKKSKSTEQNNRSGENGGKI